MPTRPAFSSSNDAVFNLRRVSVLLVFLTSLELVSASAQTSPCGVRSTGSIALSDAGAFASGLGEVPKASSRPENLKWELPLAATTGVLIGAVDQPAADRIQSPSLHQLAGRWSNIGLAMELGTSAATWMYGCGTHHPYAAETGFKALEAAAVAVSFDEGLKVAFNRQYPYSPHSTGEFWEGGKSFPSGHTAVSFAFASVMAHRYPHNPWIKWGSYALAAGVSFSRYPAKKHFPSDIVAGVPVGYLIGRYLATH